MNIKFKQFFPMSGRWNLAYSSAQTIFSTLELQNIW